MRNNNVGETDLFNQTKLKELIGTHSHIRVV